MLNKIALLAFICLSVSCKAVKTGSNPKVSKITMIAIGIGDQTEFSLTCEMFDSLNLATIDITKSKDRVIFLLDQIRPNENTAKIRKVDTRSKVRVFFTDGRVDEYCFGRFKQCIKNGQPMQLLDMQLPFFLDSLQQHR